MTREELLYEIGLSYKDLVDYLINKYGAAQHNYYVTEECKSRSRKVPRTDEGLICHHIREDMGGNLSEKHSALAQPYEWQLKENLVYCNLLEHLLLHIKIAVLRQKTKLVMPKDIEDFFTTGGIFQITGVINYVFDNDGCAQKWLKRCYLEIDNNYYEYLLLLKMLMSYIEDQYIGEKSDERFLKQGSFAYFSDGDYPIVGVTKARDKIRISTKDGDRVLLTFHVEKQMKYMDYLDMVTRLLFKGYDTFYDSIFNDYSSFEDPCIPKLLEELKIDFHGYGFPQFNEMKISKEKYGSESVDEYISKAFPVCSPEARIEYITTPVFWKGDMPKDVEERGYYYIVRVKTCFMIKEGQEPFSRFKGHSLFYDLHNREAMKDNNLIKRNGTIFSTSYIYSEKNQQYYEYYTDFENKRHRAEIEMTFDKYDFQLFFERYDVRSLTVLDGCYFI